MTTATNRLAKTIAPFFGKKNISIVATEADTIKNRITFEIEPSVLSVSDADQLLDTIKKLCPNDTVIIYQTVLVTIELQSKRTVTVKLESQ